MRFFSSASDEQRARRPTDVALLLAVVGLLAPLLVIVDPDDPTQLGTEIAGLITSLPEVLESFWRLAYDVMIAWGLVLIVAPAVSRDRWSLVRDVAVAGALALVLSQIAGELTGASETDVFSWLDDGPPAVYPASRVAMLSAVAVTASPHLSKPFRLIGRLALTMGALAAIWLQVSYPSGVLAGFLLGIGVAALVHLVFGSPGGIPTRSQIAAALDDLGIEAHHVGTTTPAAEGAVIAPVDIDGEPHEVKVYGRDAWNSQILTGVWRFLWYRDSGSVNTASRRQLVEHEGFVTLLAERAHVPVRHVIAAGVSAEGDALLVATMSDAGIDGAGGDLPADFPRAAWSALDALHGAAIAHGRIDGTTLRIDGDGRPVLTDLAAGRVGARQSDRLSDRAQMLVLLALSCGADAALDAACEGLGDERVAEMLPYLQPAALPATLRRAVKEQELDLDELRGAVERATGVEEPELEKLQRVTLGGILQMALLALAIWMLISGLSDLGLDSIVDELRSATWAWLAVGFLVAQLPRPAQAMSTIGASPMDLPVGPTVALQLAISYINLAIPSTAARVAVTVRYFRRLGATVTQATSIGALDSAAGFIVQVVLVAGLLLAGVGGISFDVDLDTATVVRLLVVCLVAIVVAVIVVVAVPRLRAKVVPPLREAVGVLGVVRSPSKAFLLFGGNLLAQLLFAAAIWCTLRAFGASASLAELVLINTIVSTFAGLLPVPGGIGVTEAGLTAGLVALGVDEPTAFATAITYRFFSFYMPPIWGFFAFTWLQRRSYL